MEPSKFARELQSPAPDGAFKISSRALLQDPIMARGLSSSEQQAEQPREQQEKEHQQEKQQEKQKEERSCEELQAPMDLIHAPPGPWKPQFRKVVWVFTYMSFVDIL